MENPMGRNIKSFICVKPGATLEIGDKVGMSSAVIWSANHIIIGNNVKIGALSIISDNDAHSLNPNDRLNYIIDEQNTKSSPVIIEDNVLIGANSIILKGVHIGCNTVIGAGSVVTKNIPSNVIAAGNPCKVIKQLEL